MAHVLDEATFGNEPPDDAIGVFVGATLPRCIRMGIEDRCSRLLREHGFLKAVDVEELAAVVCRDRFECLSEYFSSVFAFNAIEGPPDGASNDEPDLNLGEEAAS